MLFSVTRCSLAQSCRRVSSAFSQRFFLEWRTRRHLAASFRVTSRNTSQNCSSSGIRWCITFRQTSETINNIIIININNGYPPLPYVPKHLSIHSSLYPSIYLSIHSFSGLERNNKKLSYSKSTTHQNHVSVCSNSFFNHSLGSHKINTKKKRPQKKTKHWMYYVHAI